MNHLLNKELLLQAGKLYEATELKFIGKGLHNFVYEYTAASNKKQNILRMTMNPKKSFEILKEELDWMNYLRRHEVNIPSVTPSVRGNIAEYIAQDDQVICVASFSKLDGRHINVSNPEEWNERIFSKWGQLSGKIHYLTKSFKFNNIKSPNPDKEFFNLKDEKYSDFINSLPDNVRESEVIEVYEKTLLELNSLPREKDHFGFIHNDMHHRNLFVHNDEISLFDFDGCGHFWFVQDIAMPLFYAVWWGLPSNRGRKEFASQFLISFMEGYSKENTLDQSWLRSIPLFHNLRMCDLYLFYMGRRDARSLDKNLMGDIENLKHYLEKRIPFIETDVM